MPNPFENALNASRSSEKSLAGVRIRVYRNGVSSNWFVATVAQTQFFEQMGDASGFSYRSRDYCIDCKSYVIDGRVSEPQVGDVIFQMVNNKECQFEVLSLDGEQALTWMDRSRLVYRVHTKEVSSDYTTG